MGRCQSFLEGLVTVLLFPFVWLTLCFCLPKKQLSSPSQRRMYESDDIERGIKRNKVKVPSRKKQDQMSQYLDSLGGLTSKCSLRQSADMGSDVFDELESSEDGRAASCSSEEGSLGGDMNGWSDQSGGMTKLVRLFEPFEPKLVTRSSNMTSKAKATSALGVNGLLVHVAEEAVQLRGTQSLESECESEEESEDGDEDGDEEKDNVYFDKEEAGEARKNARPLPVPKFRGSSTPLSSSNKAAHIMSIEKRHQTLSSIAIKPSKDETLSSNAIKQSKAWITSYGPKVVAPNEEFTLSLWAHLLKDAGLVQKVLKRLSDVNLGSKGPVALKKKTVEVKCLRVPPGFELVTDEVETFVWEETPANVEFVFECLEDVKQGKNSFIFGIYQESALKAKVICGVTVGTKLEATSQDLKSDVVLLPSPGPPHIFLSYRRTHLNFAERIRQKLEDLGYEVFLDLSDKHGLKAGNYQTQILDKVKQTPILIPLLTKGPSSPDCQLSSIELMRQNLEKGKPDWCFEEIKCALGLVAKGEDRLIIPVTEGDVDIGAELSMLPGEISHLADLNVIKVHMDLFDASVMKIHSFIQHYCSVTSS